MKPEIANVASESDGAHPPTSASTEVFLRPDGREHARELRPLTVKLGFARTAHGSARVSQVLWISCLIRFQKVLAFPSTSECRFILTCPCISTAHVHARTAENKRVGLRSIAEWRLNSRTVVCPCRFRTRHMERKHQAAVLTRPSHLPDRVPGS
ncbi:hypothetical protein TGRUB_432440 [Toxoplasma gondii RUB]|uniref:Uncharacterized protein n=1 Tax=Toxoplasma gondii RUB TaxID=935652 RepID=A0A086LRX0_TOXGO|nr:hypothetical protein TGRUB_432440 [Toxoplasma gondii RUB]